MTANRGEKEEPAAGRQGGLFRGNASTPDQRPAAARSQPGGGNEGSGGGGYTRWQGGGQQMQLRREARPDSSADPQKAGGEEPPPPPNLRRPHFCLRCIYQSIKTGQKAMKNKKNNQS